MSLPFSVCPRETVTLPSGDSVEVRGLSRAEALRMREVYKADGVEAMECSSIAAALDATAEEVEVWYQTAANADVEALTDIIARLSGLDGDEGKGGAEDSHSANSIILTTSSPRLSG